MGQYNRPLPSLWGKQYERGEGMQPHPQQAGPKMPIIECTQENGDLKSTCTLWSVVVSFMLL
jgi:hypothetical protein